VLENRIVVLIRRCIAVVVSLYQLARWALWTSTRSTVNKSSPPGRARQSWTINDLRQNKITPRAEWSVLLPVSYPTPPLILPEVLVKDSYVLLPGSTISNNPRSSLSAISYQPILRQPTPIPSKTNRNYHPYPSDCLRRPVSPGDPRFP
jgi:hypothetical protein